MNDELLEELFGVGSRLKMYLESKGSWDRGDEGVLDMEDFANVMSDFIKDVYTLVKVLKDGEDYENFREFGDIEKFLLSHREDCLSFLACFR